MSKRQRSSSRDVLALLLGASVVAVALMAGFFYAYACSVMIALTRVDDRTFIVTMQWINATVRNAAFAPAFFGSLVLTLNVPLNEQLAAGARTAARSPIWSVALAALRCIRSSAIDPGQQFVDDLRGDSLVVKVRTGDIPPTHGTVQSDQPRDTIPPKIPRPKVARVVRSPRVVCSSAVRS
jgi:hypothetical protein